MKQSIEIMENAGRRWFRTSDRVLGGVVTSPVRTYVYPFFTPSGLIVLQEAPADQPHHQGIMAGQDLTNGHNFWSMGRPACLLNRQHVESIEEIISGIGAGLKINLHWKTAQDQSLLHEERTIRFEAWEDVNFVEVTSRLSAIFGDVYFGQTKEGGLGMRLHFELETFWGGCIHSSTGERGTEKIFDTKADWIEVNGRVTGKPAGIAMMPHPSQEQVPWFTRDYGVHLYSPRRHGPLALKAGHSTVLRCAFAAYDGTLDTSPAGKVWETYRKYA